MSTAGMSSLSPTTAPIGPSLTTQCGMYLAKRFQTPLTDCSMDLLSLLTSPNKFVGCTAASGTGRQISCLNLRQLIPFMNQLPQVNAPFSVQSASNCSLCSVQFGMRPSCRATLDLIATDIATNNDDGSCSTSYYDKVITYMLRWQPEVLCSSMLNFGYPVSTTGTLIGALDMRTTTQCGMCAAIPCLQGNNSSGLKTLVN